MFVLQSTSCVPSPIKFFASTQTSIITEAADVSTQTMWTSREVVLSVENKLCRNELQLSQGIASKTVDLVSAASAFCYENCSQHSAQFKFYTGLTVPQFIHLFSSLGTAVDNLAYYKSKGSGKRQRIKTKMKLSPQNQLFLTLVRLRVGLLHKDLAYRFKLSISTVSTIVTTWIQLLYSRFKKLDMFPDRQILRHYRPASFLKYPNCRVIIDGFEIFTQSPRNFEQQGNVYSAYKNHATFKFLIGISYTGAITFLSHGFEGSISDKEIVKQSGILDLLQEGDLVMADRGFTIKDLLDPLKVTLKIPPFLNGRDRLTPQEEVETKRIAKLRIHVERAIGRLKKFRLLEHVIPLNMAPIMSQIVFVAACLVNYQRPLIR